MRRSAPVRIGDLWDDFLSGAPTIARRIAEAKVPDIWPSIAGNRVAMYTKSIKIERGTMTVHITSAPARSEVFMNRTALRERINNTLKLDVVKNIIVK